MDPNHSSESHAALERMRARRRTWRPADAETRERSTTDTADTSTPAGTASPAPEAEGPRAPKDATPGPTSSGRSDPSGSPRSDAASRPDTAGSTGPRRARPRRALAAPGSLSKKEIKQHRRYLSGEIAPAETKETTVRRERRRRDVSDVLDSLGSPRLNRLAKPLEATAARLFPAAADPEKTKAAEARRRAAAEKAEAQAAARREQARAAAARRAEELAAVEEAAERRATEERHRREAEAETLRAEEERRLEERRAAGEERRAQLMEQARQRALDIERLRQAALERQRQAEIDAVLAESTPRPEPDPRERRGLSEVLDSLGSPNLPLERIAAPLAAPLSRLIPHETDPEKRAEAERKRREAEEKRHQEAERRRAEAAETARRRAEEWARLEAAARAREDEEKANRLAALRERQTASEQRRQARWEAEQARREAEQESLRTEAEARAAALEDARRRQAEKEAAEARAAEQEQERRRQATQEWLEETERLRRAAAVAEQRKAELKRRQEAEAERRRRAKKDQKAQAAAEAVRRKEAEQARREREAAAAAERARIQAERRAREEEWERERDRRRQAEEAERRRLAAEEAERRRKEREAAARAAAEALAAERARARRWTAAYAAVSLARARGWEDRLIAEEARYEAEEAERLRLHQERETRALRAAARRLDGTLAVPPADARPLLADVDESVSDEELVERALAVLPEWRRRDRLANKARAIETASIREEDAPEDREHTPYIAPYNLPVREPKGHARAEDRGRQAFVTAAAGLFVLAGAWGLGLFGRLGLGALDAGSYLDAHDGLYGMGATVLSPLFLHVLTWPLLFLLVGMYALHQWGPRQGYAARQRSTGWLVGLALLCLAAWFPLAILLPAGLATAAWLGALAFVAAALRGYNLTTARTAGERFFSDGTVGALAGVLVAFAPTMVALTLHSWGIAVPGVPPAVWGLAGLLLAVAAAMRLCLTERGRMSVALLFAASMAWLAIPRLLPAPLGAQQAELVGLPAIFAAFLVIVATAARRYRITQAELRLRRR
ncbi:hypothetical protein ACL90Y_11565 [Micrococcus luteus]